MKTVKPILLIFPPYEGKFMLESRFPFPLGLLYIGAFLSEKGIESKIMDFSYPRIKSKISIIGEGGSVVKMAHYGKTFSDIRRWLQDNLKNYQDIIGISSLMSTNHTSSYRIVKIIKDLSQKATVVMGGPHATVFPQHVRDFSMTDFVCEGEGERSFYDFIKNGKFSNGFVEDLDSLPFPNRSLLLSSLPAYKEIPVTFSRGCPHKCSFCGSYLMQGRMWRHKSVDRVISELDWYLHEWKVRSFIIEDDNLCPQKSGIEWIKQICGSVIGKVSGRQWPPLRFRIPHGIPLYGTADSELCDLMWEAGFRKMVFPLESSNPNVLRDMNKVFTAKVFNEATDNWGRYEKNSPVEIILGYPFVDTIQTMLETVRTVSGRHLLIWPSHFRPNYGIPLFSRCVEAGYIREDRFDPMSSADFSVETERFNLNDLNEIRQICRGVNFGTELGFDLFAADPKAITSKDFTFCYGKEGRIVAKGNFKFRRGQDIFSGLLVAKSVRNGCRPIIKLDGNLAILRGFKPSRVYAELEKLI